MSWFAVRSIYLFDQKFDGTNVFEERVVCFEAETPAAALDKAALESKQYATSQGFEVFPDRIAYEQEGNALIDGYEVWSELFESRESLAQFYASRYARYEYHPE